MKRIIFHDQLEFVPGVQGWFNVEKSVSVICHINKNKGRKNKEQKT